MTAASQGRAQNRDGRKPGQPTDRGAARVRDAAGAQPVGAAVIHLSPTGPVRPPLRTRRVTGSGPATDALARRQKVGQKGRASESIVSRQDGLYSLRPETSGSVRGGGA